MTEAEQQEQHYSTCSQAKAEGAFIALAAGDALGWPQELPQKVVRSQTTQVSTEFREWVRRGGGRFYPHEEVIRAGEYSDDTQLTMAVARSRLIAGPAWWTTLTRTEIPLWTLYQRGGGGATIRAANNWAQGTPPWQVRKSDHVGRYFEAGGNGVAMRVIPHALFFAGEPDAQQLLHDVVMDGVATHGHPRALIGAAAYAFAAWWLLRVQQTLAFGEIVEVLLDEVTTWGAFPVMANSQSDWLDAANSARGDDYEKVWQEVTAETCRLLERVRTGLQEGALADDDAILKDLGAFGKSKGSGVISAAAAIYLVSRYATQPAQAILRAAFAHGADTDTIAAMVGGLAGCLGGTEWMPREWLDVQDSEYLKDIARKVSRGPDAAVERPPALKVLKKEHLDTIRAALVEGCEDDLDMDGIRKAEVIEHLEPRPLSKTTTVDAWLLRAKDGQTLYITKFGRRLKMGEPSEPKAETRASRNEKSVAKIVGMRLSVRDLDRAVLFYQQAFGLIPAEQARGSVNFGVLSLVDIRFARKVSNGAIDDDPGKSTSMIEIGVPNLEDSLEQVQQAGGKIIHEIKDMSSGRRCFRCFDLDENILEVTGQRSEQNGR